MLRIEPIDMSGRQAALELLLLQLESYQVEAKLIGFDEIPPLTDSIATLQKSKETFIGCRDGEALVGAAAYTASEEEATICRMMVHPGHFRRGIATMLLRDIERRIPASVPLHVSTGTRNVPAMELYLKHGFEPVNEVLVARGITITFFTKQRGAPPLAEERP